MSYLGRTIDQGAIEMLVAYTQPPVPILPPQSVPALSGAIAGPAFVLAYGLLLWGICIVAVGMNSIPTCRKKVTKGLGVIMSSAVIWIGTFLVLGRWV